MSSLLSLSAVDLIARYRARTLTPSEVMEAVIDQVKRREP